MKPLALRRRRDFLRNFRKFSALAPPLTPPRFSIEFIMGFLSTNSRPDFSTSKTYGGSSREPPKTPLFRTLFRSKTLSDRSTVKKRGFRPTGFCPTSYTGTPLKTNGAWGGCAPHTPRHQTPAQRPQNTPKTLSICVCCHITKFQRLSTHFEIFQNFPPWHPPLRPPDFPLNL